MPKSETGTTTESTGQGMTGPSCSQAVTGARRPGRGFTLIEVLVVVAIAAILAALAVLQLGTLKRPDSPDFRLRQLAGLLEAQCQQALFQARPRGLRVTTQGYDFWQHTAEGWVVLAGSDLDQPRQWPGAWGFDLVVEGHRLDLGDEPPGPQIACYPLGELTPFSLAVNAEPGHPVRVTGSSDGRLALETGP